MRLDDAVTLGKAFEPFFTTRAEPGGMGSVGRVGPGGGQHVLYLDDDESLEFLVERLLKRRGVRVSGFTDQHAALEALPADPARFDLVVTDYNMPGMSGLDVAREVRAIRDRVRICHGSPRSFK